VIERGLGSRDLYRRRGIVSFFWVSGTTLQSGSRARCKVHCPHGSLKCSPRGRR
jgi:hypothetical protein